MKPAALGVIAGVAAGAAVGAASRGPSLVEWPSKIRTAFPFVIGGIAGASVGIKVGAFASLVDAARGKGKGPMSTVAPVIVGAGLATAAAVGGTIAKDKVLGGLEQQSRDLDPYFATSSGVVTPLRILMRPSPRRLRMPPRMAAARSLETPARWKASSRISLFMIIISKIAFRPR